MTRLHEAASKGDLIQIRHILSEPNWHADVRGIRDATALFHAVASGKLEAIKLLVELGADVNATSSGTNGETALHSAILLGEKAAAATLLSCNANVNAVTTSGDTPLHWAAIYGGSLELCRLLMLSGAQLSAQNEAGYTPREYAEEMDRSEQAHILRSAEKLQPHSKPVKRCSAVQANASLGLRR